MIRQVQGKLWGRTSPIFARNNVEIHRIEGTAGGYCSRHFHAHKHNLFFVERGRLMIEAWANGDEADVTELGAGEFCTVPPGHPHRFTDHEACVAFEVYWVELSGEDIVRESRGGAKT